MPRNYLLYWKLTTVQREDVDMTHPLLDHAASNQLEKVKPDDVLWVITLQSGKLYLVGRLVVGALVDEQTAKGQLGEDIWEADWHVLAKPQTSEPMRRVDISLSAFDLRFQSDSGKDRLALRDGRFDVLQLRSMRLLSDDSVNLLSIVWHGQEFVPENTLELLETWEDYTAFQEGQVVWRSRQERQRSQKLVKLAKERFKALHGRLYCEVCGFDFVSFYGDIGEGYIEAHHKNPLSEAGEQVSSLSDLVMLCANCHRMIHQEQPPIDADDLQNRLRRKQ